MTSTKNKKLAEYLLPGEKIIDCLRFTSFYRGSEFALTDQRLLVSGYTGSLGPSFTLLRGTMVAGFPLTEFESFVIGTGRRPLLLFTSLALAVAGGMMASFAYTRYSGLVVFALALFSFLAWTAWPRTFVTVSGGGVKISGRVRHRGAVVFLERIQLAACAAKAGGSPAEVVEAAALSGKSAESCAEEPGDAPGAKKPGDTPERAD
jgi:hypothetical protein